MKPRIMLIGLMVLMLGATLTTENTENTETLVIDLSKRLPDNPYQEEYERMLYPTVRVKTPNSTGSGVIISHRGTEDTENTIYILTAAHVVGNESTVTVEFFSHQDTKTPSSSCLSAFVAMTDTIKDLALLTTDSHRLTQVYSARLAPKNYVPYLFSPVWVVGCSLGLPPRPSFGHLCDLSASAVNWEISAPILPGNSGGPVFDGRTYEVIGIAVWVHTYKDQLVTTMAGIVPISEICEFLDSHKGSKTQR